MKTTITKTRMVNGKATTLYTEEIEQIFAITEEKCVNGINSYWLMSLDSVRICPMYIDKETLDKLKPNMLVSYERYYRHGDMGQSETVKIVDFAKLEEKYFS